MVYYLEQQYNMLATNETFRKRVVMGFFVVARDVLGESSQTTGHPMRANFARRIIMETDVSQGGYVAAIATDPDVTAAAVAKYNSGDATQKQQVDWAQSGVTNDQILAAISKAWNALSGYEESGQETPAQ